MSDAIRCPYCGGPMADRPRNISDLLLEERLKAAVTKICQKVSVNPSLLGQMLNHPLFCQDPKAVATRLQVHVETVTHYAEALTKLLESEHGLLMKYFVEEKHGKVQF